MAAKPPLPGGNYELLALCNRYNPPGPCPRHAILDNYSTHKHPVIKRWLARHPSFELHFTPTGSSWMNLVERFFRDLSQQAILPGSFGSVRQLVDAIMQYLARHNLKPKRYVWRAKGEEILAKIQRAWKAALGENKTVTII